MVINLNDPQVTAKDIMAVTGLDEFFCKVMIKARSLGQYRLTTYVNQIWDFYESLPTSYDAPEVFEDKMDTLNSHISQKQILF